MKPRITTPDQDRELATWYAQLRSLGSVRQKARELGISVAALYDAIARGEKQPTHNERHKLAVYLREQSAKLREPSKPKAKEVPRESVHSDAIEEVA